MNLYLLSQKENDNYDTYDSVVVAANTEDEARLIHPDCNTNLSFPPLRSSEECWEDEFSRWCSAPNKVNVQLMGIAVEGTKSGIILASFNAG